MAGHVPVLGWDDHRDEDWLAEARRVRKAGLEPARPKAPEPKSGAYTNFATSA